MTRRLTHHDFTPHVGQAFAVEGWPSALLLHDIAVVSGSDAFTLIFHGPGGTVLPEGLHTLRPEAGEALELYVMPIHTPARDRQDYQAVFN